jgi:hypothetical protein
MKSARVAIPRAWRKTSKLVCVEEKIIKHLEERSLPWHKFGRSMEVASLTKQTCCSKHGEGMG